MIHYSADHLPCIPVISEGGYCLCRWGWMTSDAEPAVQDYDGPALAPGMQLSARFTTAAGMREQCAAIRNGRGVGWLSYVFKTKETK